MQKYFCEMEMQAVYVSPEKQAEYGNIDTDVEF